MAKINQKMQNIDILKIAKEVKLSVKVCKEIIEIVKHVLK